MACGLASFPAATARAGGAEGRTTAPSLPRRPTAAPPPPPPPPGPAPPWLGEEPPASPPACCCRRGARRGGGGSPPALTVRLRGGRPSGAGEPRNPPARGTSRGRRGPRHPSVPGGREAVSGEAWERLGDLGAPVPAGREMSLLLHQLGAGRRGSRPAVPTCEGKRLPLPSALARSSRFSKLDCESKNILRKDLLKHREGFTGEAGWAVCTQL